MEDKVYFGYYSWNGHIHRQKWVGNEPVGGYPNAIIQKHELTEREVELCLEALAIIYPFKGLVVLQ